MGCTSRSSAHGWGVRLYPMAGVGCGPVARHTRLFLKNIFVTPPQKHPQTQPTASPQNTPKNAHKKDKKKNTKKTCAPCKTATDHATQGLQTNEKTCTPVRPRAPESTHRENQPDRQKHPTALEPRQGCQHERPPNPTKNHAVRPRPDAPAIFWYDP